MKKIFSLAAILLATAMFTLTSCSGGNGTEDVPGVEHKEGQGTTQENKEEKLEIVGAWRATAKINLSKEHPAVDVYFLIKFDKDGKYIAKNKLVKPVEGLTEEENDNWKYEDRGTYKIEADKLIRTSELEAPGYETITVIIQKFSKNSITIFDPKEKEEQFKSFTLERIPESDF